MIDRLLARFGFWRWPEANGHRDTDPVSRGNRWQNFYGEEGGLSDMLTAMRRSYFERATQAKPGDTDTLLALSLADRIVAEIDGQVRAIIVEGEVAATDRKRADQIAALPEAMRRRL